MSTTPTPITLVGATGLTGSRALSAILASTHPFNLTLLSRRSIELSPPSGNPQTTHSLRLFSDLSEAPTGDESIVEEGGIYVSCMGTTRAKAGSQANQEKIDLILNGQLAKRAKDDGASMMILVSTAGASANSSFFYPRIKGQLEEQIKELGFERTVILRPATILGTRDESRPAEYAFQSTFRGLRRLGLPMNQFCIDAEDIGACIAHLAANPPTEAVTTLWDNEMIAHAKAYRATLPSSGSR
ncbi:hypothetical protein IAU60_005359 [Kwoniella sp. DSM 27419]